MISITKAIITRWDAKSLDDTITGGIHHSRLPPNRIAMPYVIYNELSAPVSAKTRRSIYTDFNIQFDVYSQSADPEAAYDKAELIRNTMVEGENAVADPLSITAAEGSILETELEQDILVVDEGEQVYRAFFSMRIRVGRARVRTPA